MRYNPNIRIRRPPPKAPKPPVPPKRPMASPPSPHSRKQNLKETLRELAHQNWFQEDFGTSFGRKQHNRQHSNFDVRPTPFRTTPEIKVSFTFAKGFFKVEFKYCAFVKV